MIEIIGVNRRRREGHHRGEAATYRQQRTGTLQVA